MVCHAGDRVSDEVLVRVQANGLMTATRPSKRTPSKSRTAADVLATHRMLLQREAYFRKFGYDSPRSIAFTLSHALPLKGSVLEIGTGKGRFLVQLARHANAVATVDVNAGAQVYARLNARHAGVEDRIQFVLGDAARLSWPDHTFDAAVTFNAIHHIPDFQSVLKEMLRVVKPGGKIVLADFSPRGFQIMARMHRSEGKTHQHESHPLRDLQRQLRGRGLTTRWSKGCHQEVLVATQPPVLE